jgi:hypothetical protein
MNTESMLKIESINFLMTVSLTDDDTPWFMELFKNTAVFTQIIHALLCLNKKFWEKLHAVV